MNFQTSGISRKEFSELSIFSIPISEKGKGKTVSFGLPNSMNSSISMVKHSNNFCGDVSDEPEPSVLSVAVLSSFFLSSYD